MQLTDKPLPGRMYAEIYQLFRQGIEADKACRFGEDEYQVSYLRGAAVSLGKREGLSAHVHKDHGSILVWFDKKDDEGK